MTDNKLPDWVNSIQKSHVGSKTRALGTSMTKSTTISPKSKVQAFGKILSLLQYILPTGVPAYITSQLAIELQNNLGTNGIDSFIKDELLFAHYRMPTTEHGEVDHIRIAFSKDNNVYYVIQVHTDSTPMVAFHPEQFDHLQVQRYFHDLAKRMPKTARKITHTF